MLHLSGLPEAFFDHDSMRQCLILGTLWQVAGWERILQCLKLDQSRQGLKNPASSREKKIRRRKKFSRNCCKVHTGYWLSYRCLFTLVFIALFCSYHEVKGLWGFMWFWHTQKKKQVLIVSSFSCVLKVKVWSLCAHLHG